MGEQPFRGVTETLVISTREPVITQTALRPSGHAFSTQQTWRSVNVSVAECPSSSAFYTFLHRRRRLKSLPERILITQMIFSVSVFALDDVNYRIILLAHKLLIQLKKNLTSLPVVRQCQVCSDRKGRSSFWVSNKTSNH